jgi:hypothetical protein
MNIEAVKKKIRRRRVKAALGVGLAGITGALLYKNRKYISEEVISPLLIRGYLATIRKERSNLDTKSFSERVLAPGLMKIGSKGSEFLKSVGLGKYKSIPKHLSNIGFEWGENMRSDRVDKARRARYSKPF